MTWKQIKEIFEANGVKDTDEIVYIDIGYEEDIVVERRMNGELEIYN